MQKEVLSVIVEERTSTGTKQTNLLRQQGIIPGVIYGEGLGSAESFSVQVKALDLKKVLAQIEESSLVEVVLAGKSYPSLVKDVQYNPIKSTLLSVDFFAPNLSQEVETPVSLEFVGVSESEKSGNTLVKIHSEIEVKAFPTNLPEHILVDISQLKTVEDVIRVSDLVVPEGVTVLLEPDELIALTEFPEVETEPELSSEQLDALEKEQAEKNSKDKTENS